MAGNQYALTLDIKLTDEAKQTDAHLYPKHLPLLGGSNIASKRHNTLGSTVANHAPIG